jgi:CRISPR-associated protein Csy1
VTAPEQPLLAQAKAARAAGQLAQAEQLYRDALALDSRQPEAWYRLAEVLEDLGKPDAAMASLEQTLHYAPNHAQTLHYLGLLLTGLQRYDEAVTRFRQAVASKPDYVRAHNNLGNALRAMGRIDEAAASFVRATQLQPDYAFAWLNLGSMYREQGRMAEAEAALRQASRLQPAHRDTLLALAQVLRQNAKPEESADCYRQLIVAHPQERNQHVVSLAAVLIESGRPDEAHAIRAEALAQAPQSLQLALETGLELKAVYDSAEDVEQTRARYAEGLARLRNEVDRYAQAGAGEVTSALIRNNFYLAYHGEDDTRLQREYGHLVADLLDRAWPEFRRPVARHPSGRRRIGFASSFFYESTVGVYFKSWIAGLAMDGNDIFIYHLHPHMNPLAESLRRLAYAFRPLGGTRDPQVVAPAIRDDALDVLIYPELGMDGLAFVLAALRLAPVQCAGWGHPVTTGHATMDYYFSSAAMEPDDGARHYTETLVPLPGIGTCYTRPPLSGPATRKSIGLPEDRHIYLCQQSLFKIHPVNDSLMARVLLADNDGILVCFQERSRQLTAQFTRRLAGAFAACGLDFEQRVVMLPHMPREDFLRVNQVSDVMLDTLRWSGGNTSLDALSTGLPPVTLPGAFMRGRQTYAMLRLLGIPELVATDQDDYVRIATRLAGDPDWRREISTRIVSGHEQLFDDMKPVAALQRFIREVAP